MLRALALAFVLLGCDPEVEDTPAPEPGPLRVGLAEARIPAPLGIGTSGFAGFLDTANPTPFSELFPGTVRLHGHPNFKAVVLSRGDDFEVVFLRIDAIGVFQQLRTAVVDELYERTGRDFDDILVMGATHTHSGPGRVVQGGGFYNLISDTFFPEFYERMVSGMADVVEAAYADLEPARIGFAEAQASDAHRDRRCADGEDYENGRAPILLVERDGQIDAALMSFAVHGTVLDLDDYTLSADVHGAIEEAVEGRFEHPVQAVLFNAWGGDMAPSGPAPLTTGAVLPGGYDQMRAVGRTFADAFEIAIQDVVWEEEPELSMHSYRVPLSREAIGYEGDEFPYPNGGVYCESEVDCQVAPQDFPGLDSACLAFPEDYPAPDRTTLSVGRIGSKHFVTWPGEGGTRLAEDVLALLEERDGVEDVLFYGYAQDYVGYSLQEEDWWHGGYEAAGALWGPKQGDYLAERLVQVFDHAFAGGSAPADLLEPAPPFVIDAYTPYTSAEALTSPPTDVAATYAPDGIISFTVSGLDPWEGAPTAQLATASDELVLRPGGQPVDSDSYGFWVDLEPSPAYPVQASARDFRWTFSLPATAADGLHLLGDYRIVVTLADGQVVRSSVFTVTE